MGALDLVVRFSAFNEASLPPHRQGSTRLPPPSSQARLGKEGNNPPESSWNLILKLTEAIRRYGNGSANLKFAECGPSEQVTGKRALPKLFQFPICFQYSWYLQLQGRVAFLPFVAAALKALKTKETDFEPQTLGEHLKKRRLNLGLTQNEAAKCLGVTSFTVINWECCRCRPAIQHFPPIRQFLGYDPVVPTAETLTGRLAAKRRELGWSQKEAARELGTDPSTWSSWETGGTIMSKSCRRLIAKFIGLPDSKVDAAMRKHWNGSHKQANAQ